MSMNWSPLHDNEQTKIPYRDSIGRFTNKKTFYTVVSVELGLAGYPLAHGFIKHNGASARDIERVDSWSHGDDHTPRTSSG